MSDIDVSARGPDSEPEPLRIGTITYHRELTQGSEEWLQARCGLLTASEMKLIITPTLKIADNDKVRAHLWELLCQRITQYVEPHYISDDMLRGMDDEIRARTKYEELRGPVEQIGFITNDRWGFTLGYSPDGLVGTAGAIEAKSRRGKYQVQTIVENIGNDGGSTIPADYLMQHQTGLLVSEREWIDFISYSGGLPMAIIRVWPDTRIQNAIVEAAGEFERRLAIKLAVYQKVAPGLIPTERTIVQEMFT
jgi:hypothetical protein